MRTLGYDKPLYIVPFDRRGSFQTKLSGWNGALTPEQTAQIAASKQVIYDGFKAAIRSGVQEQKSRHSCRRTVRQCNSRRRSWARLHHRVPSGEERAGRVRF